MTLSVLVLAALLMLIAWQLAQIAQSPSVLPDSGTALSISRRLADGDWRAVWATQSPPLQDGMYALLLRLGWGSQVGYPGALSILGLAALLGWFAYKATGMVAAAGLPVALVLFSDVVWEHSGYLTFYPAFVLFGYAGLYFALRYAWARSSFANAVWAAILLALALAAYTTALVFLIVPAIACVVLWSREAMKRTAILYGAIMLATAPWFVWHVAVGGLEHVYYHPLNWFSEKYLAIVNERFWQYPRQSLLDYASAMWKVAANGLLPKYLLVLVLPGFVFVGRRFGLRASLLAVSCLAAYAGVLAVTRPSPFARYFFPILPLVLLLASAGLVSVAHWLRHAAWPKRGASLESLSPIIAAGLGVLVVTILAGYPPPPVDQAHDRFVNRLETSAGYKDMTAMAELIDATNGGVIARDSAIQAVVPDNQVFTHYLLSEQEYVTFLTWPSDRTVAAVLRDREIEWVLLRNDTRWERDYHVWVNVAYGQAPRHYTEIVSSPYFVRAYSGSIYTLYRLLPDATAPLPPP